MVWVVLLALCDYAPGQATFVYTNDNIPEINTVTGFSVGEDGTLTQIAAPFPTGGAGTSGEGDLISPNRIVVGGAMGNYFLFASDDGSNDVSVFSIDPNTGILTSIGPPFPTGQMASSGMSLAITPDGTFLMAGNSDSNNITVFSIAANGGLTEVAGSPFPALGTTDGMKMSPNDTFLAAGLSGPVAVLSLAATGTLTQVSGSPFPGSGEDTGIDINCPGNRLFAAVPQEATTAADVFRLAANGTLTLVETASPGSGSLSNGVLLSPNNQLLFVSNYSDDSITVFKVAFNGGLTVVSGSPFTVNSSGDPSLMATNQAGTLLFTANYPAPGASIGVFRVASDGSLTEVVGSPFPVTGSFLNALAVFPAATCASASNFTISASPASLSVAQGTQGTSTITTAISGGFNSAIALSASGAPSGTTVIFNPNPIPAPGAGSSTMTITVGSSTVPGTYPITVTGTGVGGIQRNVTVMLTVTGPSTFTISASPDSLRVAPGNQGTSTITTAITGGFNSAIALSASGAPSGTTVIFNPNPIPAPGAGSSTMTITVGSSTVPATYPITVTGTSPGIQQNVTVTLTVTSPPTFTISASPTSLPVAQGNEGTSTITTAISGGFNSAITLSASGAPSGTTVIFNPNPIPAPGAGSSTMTITVGSSTVPGTYPITVTGTSPGIQQNVTVRLVVTSLSNFTISASPASLPVAQGNEGTSTITTAISGGFNSAIALSASGAPSGTTVIFNPSSIPAPGSGSSTMTITVGSSTVPGTYPITVTGTGVGGIQQNVALTLTVPTAPPTCGPPPGMPLVQPGSGSLTVVVTATCTDTTGTITKVMIDWGDDSPVDSSSTSTITGTHTYAQAGPYTITVTATNNFGQPGSTNQAVTLPWSVTGVFPGQPAPPILLSFTLPQTPGQPPPAMVPVTFSFATVTLLGSPGQQAKPCIDQPYGISCSCSPSSGTLYPDKSTSVTLTVQTTGGTTALLRPAGSPWLRASLALWMPLPAIVLLGSGFLGSITKRSAVVRYVALGLVAILLLIVTSCGGGFTPPSGSSPPSQKQTPPGNYLITIGAVDSNGFVQTSLIVPLEVTSQ